MRDFASLAAAARRHGDAVGFYSERRWTPTCRVRVCGRSTAARPGPRYGPPGHTALRPGSWTLDVVNVTKNRLDAGECTEGTRCRPPATAAAGPGYARDPAEVPDTSPALHSSRRKYNRDHTIAVPGQPGPAHHPAGAQARRCSSTL